MYEELQDIETAVINRLSNARERMTKAESDLGQAKDELMFSQAAADRVQLLRTGGRKFAIDDCLRCFVMDNHESKMTPIPSDVGDIDLFRCRKCGIEVERKA